MRKIRCVSQRSDNQHESINIRDDTEILQKTTNQSVLEPGNINMTFSANYKESSHVDSSLKFPVTGKMQETLMHLKIRMEHLTPDKQNEMTTLIFNSRDLFSQNDHDIGCFTATDNGPSKVRFHVIDNKETCYAISRKVPCAQRTWSECHLEESCKNGVITEINHSNSTVQISPVLIVPNKRKNRYRMAVDYRQLNDNLRPATSPLPNTKNYLESLAKKRIFSTLDTASAFNQLEVDEKTKLLAGFVTLGRRLITNRMPFGAKLSPGIFQEICKEHDETS